MDNTATWKRERKMQELLKKYTFAKLKKLEQYGKKRNTYRPLGL